jgi:hypothetical protein
MTSSQRHESQRPPRIYEEVSMASPILFVLMSTSAFTDNISIVFLPGQDPNFTFFDSGTGFNLLIGFAVGSEFLCDICFSRLDSRRVRRRSMSIKDASLTIGANSFSFNSEVGADLLVGDATLCSYPSSRFPPMANHFFSITETASFDALVTIW